MSNCKNLCCRHKKGILYFFCKKMKIEINLIGCSHCLNKEYPNYRNLNCGHKRHKLTKKTSIDCDVKSIVYERDNHCCIFCGKNVSKFYANSHYINRSQLGLGCEENLFTACIDCHHNYDNSIKRKQMKKVAKKYLQSKYNDWNEKKLIYRKFGVINGS